MLKPSFKNMPIKSGIELALFLFLSLLPFTTKGQVLVYNFSGTITNISSVSPPSLANSLPLNSAFNASFQINLDNTTDVNPTSPDGNYYAYAPGTSVTVSVGDLSFATLAGATQAATIQTNPSTSTDTFFGFYFNSPQLGDAGSATNLQIILKDSSFSRSLPTELPPVNELTSATWTMNLYNGTDEFSVSGIVNSVGVEPLSAPEPSVFALSIVGILSLWLAGRMRPSLFRTLFLPTSQRLPKP